MIDGKPTIRALMNTIREMTKDCERNDCAIQENGPASVTCMNWTPTFDKLGQRTDRGNPNITTRYLACRTCGAQWRTDEQYNETRVSYL